MAMTSNPFDPTTLHPSNTEQAEYWNGAGGKRWTTYQAALDRSLAPFGAALLAQSGAEPGQRVLDVGCGCGDTSIAFADRIGDAGAVLGVDLSSEMLERARERAGDRSNVRFVVADAARLATDERFDRIVSRFGVMFFGDPVGAFRHLRALLRPEGRLAFVCWRAHEDNPWGLVPVQAVRRAVPNANPPAEVGAVGPFAFADPDRVRQVLEDAGFATPRVEPFDADVVFSANDLGEAVEFALYAGPSARLLAGADPDAIARARAELAQALAPFRTHRGIALRGASWLVTSG